MAVFKMNPVVNFYFTNAKQWREELEALRMIALHCGLTEELKWGCPCYTVDKSNIVLIHAFKNYCAFLFFKGALLQDGDGILIQQTKNVQAARQARFTTVQEIIEQEPVLKAYIHEAIAIEKAGLKVEYKKPAEHIISEEFNAALKKDPALKTAFDALTPGRQRAYLLHFAAPKQAKTRAARIEKSRQQILAGKGLNE